MNIFERLNMLLTESDGGSKAKESDIPIHPEMETKEQGEMAAAEKILKLFQKLKASFGSSEEEIKDSKPEIPDDIIDPMMKERPKSSKDKSFEKNKLAGWDEESEEKVKKEVDVDSGDTEDDEYDDFDYRRNPFGDEDDEDDDTSGYDDEDDDRSEDEKLRDSIDDAIDSLGGDEDEGEDGGEDDSGADWGDDEGEDGGQQGGDSQSGKQQGGRQGGQQDSQQGEEGSESSNESGGQSSTKDGGKGESRSAKQKRLEDLKKSLESEGMTDFNETMREIKDATDIPESNETTGGQIENPSDEDFKSDMKKGGFDDETIDEMTKKKNTNPNDDYSEEEMEKLKKQVVDGLEDACKKKGGSALASTIVKNSLKRKLNDEEWREMLKIFLKAKSIGVGNMSSANKGIKWGHKNHLWRDAVLPTTTQSKGTIQNIYCFVDFSGSVDKDLVFPFLGKVIDMCVELKYTTVKVYGFGEKLTLPRVLDQRALSKGSDVALEQTWDFI